MIMLDNDDTQNDLTCFLWVAVFRATSEGVHRHEQDTTDSVPTECFYEL